MEIKCEYCGSMIPDNVSSCPNCGAPCRKMKRTSSGTPKTIEELEKWYKARKLPPYEKTRFFIGINYKRPKAIGIYEENGEFIVYKNKADGTRVERYRGTDEAYAVNEVYLKLKSEILKQKERNASVRQAKVSRPRSRSLSDLFSGLSMGGIYFLVLALIFFGAILYYAIRGDVAPKYYDYNDTIYVDYGGDFYAYDSSTYDYYPVDSDIFGDDLEEYAIDDSSSGWSSSYDFTSSDYYEDNIDSGSSSYSSSSSSSSSGWDWDSDDDDSDWDWDSGSDWDYDSSDWDSDW